MQRALHIYALPRMQWASEESMSRLRGIGKLPKKITKKDVNMRTFET